MTIFWLVIINLFGLLVLNRLNLFPDNAYVWMRPDEYFQTKTWDPLKLHDRWDSVWYLDIVQNGYYLKGENKLSNPVFFPLYPLVIKAVSYLTLGNYLLAGWLVSSIFAIASAAALYKLVQKFHPDLDPAHPVIFLLIFPTAFFLNNIYSESMFLFFTLVSFYFALQKKFLYAGLLGLLAASTRSTGVLIFIPLLYEYYKAYPLHKGRFSPQGLGLLLIPLGTLGFFTYHYLAFGDFWLFLHLEKLWGRGFVLNWEHFQTQKPAEITNFALDLLALIFGLVIGLLVMFKIRVSYGLLILSVILVAISTGTLMSINRYLLPLFPIYIFASEIKNTYIKYSWILISALLLALNIIQWVGTYWAG